MRELKFRAWDTVELRMVGNSAARSENGGFNYPWGFQTGTNPILIMQFTGLKDKNGTDIYEGDIVSYGVYCQEVEYKEHEDGDGALVMGYGFASYSMKNVEVIGNIHQNPELLARKKKEV